MGPPTDGEGRPPQGPANVEEVVAQPPITNDGQCNAAPPECGSSRQVSWWSVHEWVQTRIDQAGEYPMAGTPAWCALPDNDRRKWAALLDAAQHWALRVETAQEARCAASRAISGAADWPAVAQEIQQRTNFRGTRPWARRVAS